MSKIGRWYPVILFSAQVLWSGPLAVVMVVRWRGALDEPDVSYACGAGATCFSGPTVAGVLALLLGAVALVCLSIVVAIFRRRRVRAVRRARLSATGTRVPGMVVAVQRPRFTIEPYTDRVTVEARVGEEVVRAVAHCFVSPPVGTWVTVAHDPAHPDEAAVVEDLDALVTEAQRQAEHYENNLLPTPPTLTHAA